MSPKRRSKKKKSVLETAQPEESKSQSSSWIFVAFALAGVCVFALVLLGTEPPPRPTPPPAVHPVDAWRALPVQPVSYAPERDFARGPEDAAVSILTFSDFECQHCRDANMELERLRQRYPEDVQIVFKNYPLDMACNENMTRPNFLHSCKAAVMSRCAGAQDRFWDMHDAIYTLPQLSVSALDALPVELGIAGEAYDACIASEEPMQDIQADIDQGRTLGVTGTPSIFINGRKMPSFRAQTIETIVAHVASESDGL